MDDLLRCSLPLTLCRGQAYDGASNMSCVRNGVQAEETGSVYFICTHSLNLCVQEVSKQIEVVRNVMDLIYYLVQLKFSPKRATM